MLNVRREDGDKGSSIFTFEKGGKSDASILVLTKNIKGWTLELPKTTITESSSNMQQIQELTEALGKVSQIVESDGFNLAGVKTLPAKGRVEITTVGTAVKDKKEKKVKIAKIKK